VAHYPFLLCRRPAHLQHPGTTRVSQVPDVSLHASHALWTPAGPPSTHPFLGALCVGFWPVNTIAACFIALTRLYQALGSAVFPTGYVVPCIRLNCFVRSCSHLLNDLPDNCNTRYGWMVSPSPAGTCTLQETPSSLGALKVSVNRANPPQSAGSGCVIGSRGRWNGFTLHKVLPCYTLYLW